MKTKDGCCKLSIGVWERVGEYSLSWANEDSWFVTTAHHNDDRLKVLKDEIRKPYFLALKEFLWKEGLRGLDDTSPSLKIYPPGEYRVFQTSTSWSYSELR